ncbi:MAG: hypothetical protein ACFFCQ_09450 [Promethearchaeota archaeon]
MTPEYVERFGYRKYEGKIEARWKRIWNLARFELINTWHKSTFGKVILIVLIIVNFFSITVDALIIAQVEKSEFIYWNQMINASLRDFVARYYALGLLFGMAVIRIDVPDEQFVPLGMTGIFFFLGFLLIGLISISGSGIFADDRQGKVIEIYLSKLQTSEYVIGKILAIFLYINFFTTLPLFSLGVFYVQALGETHLDFLDYYVGILLSGILNSLLLSLFILIFSIMAEKRSFASLGFFLSYLMFTLFGGIIYQVQVNTQDSPNEFLYLLSPSTFCALVTYSCFRTYELKIGHDTLLDLNDGSGLDFYHIFGLSFLLIMLMTLFLLYRVKRMTTEELG